MSRRAITASSMPIEPVRLGPNRMALIGAPEALHEQLEARRRAGVLLSATDLLPTGDGRFVTTVTVTRPDRPVREVRPVGRWQVAGVGVVASGWAAIIAFAALSTVAAALALWQLRFYLLGGAAVLGGGSYLLGRLGVCPGIHCPGCSHR